MTVRIKNKIMSKHQRQERSRQALADRPCENRDGNVVGVDAWKLGERLCVRCRELAEQEQRAQEEADHVQRQREFIDRLMANDAINRMLDEEGR